VLEDNARYLRIFHKFMQSYRTILLTLIKHIHNVENNDGNVTRNSLSTNIQELLTVYYTNKENIRNVKDCMEMTFHRTKLRTAKDTQRMICLMRDICIDFCDYDCIDKDTPLSSDKDDSELNEEERLLKILNLTLKRCPLESKTPRDMRIQLSDFSDMDFAFLFQKGISHLESYYDPIMEFMFYITRNYASQNIDHLLGWKNMPLDDFRNRIMACELDREHVANCICFEERSTAYPLITFTPIMRDKLDWLKIHILDERTSIEWISKFLMAVTGSPYLHDNTKIILEPVLYPVISYYVSHTCYNQIDVSPDVVGCPGLTQDELEHLSPYEIFIKNITDGLIAHRDHMNLA
jgi:hypothetical protein